MIKQLITSMMNNSVTEDQPVCFPGNIWPCQLESGSITGLKILFLELIVKEDHNNANPPSLLFILLIWVLSRKMNVVCLKFNPTS